MAVTVGASGMMSGAAGFDDLDASTAVAGASAVLSDYFASNEDAARKIASALSPIIAVSEETEAVGGNDKSGVTSEETLYESAVKGLAGAEGVLNVREAPSTLSNIVECVVRGGEVTVIGERVVNGNLWYKVRYNGIEGYVAGNYLAFGTEADELAYQVAKEQANGGSLPESFAFADDLYWVDQSIQDQLNYYAREINFCISTNYPTESEKNNYIGMYSILLYLLENYQCIMDIANEYGMAETYSRAAADLDKVNSCRIYLSAYTGSTEEQFVASIMETAPETTTAAAPEPTWVAEAPVTQPAAPAPAPAPETPAPAPAPQPAAPAPAPETPAPQPAAPAPAPETPAPQPAPVSGDIGSQIAAFAAQWVGQINYVWGGNDFRVGGGVDCSHFTYNVYLHFGLTSYYSTSGGQRGWGHAVDISQIQPGDLVCYDGHVAIYYGNGTIVHAPAPGRMIEFGSLYVLPVVAVRRMY